MTWKNLTHIHETTPEAEYERWGNWIQNYLTIVLMTSPFAALVSMLAMHVSAGSLILPRTWGRRRTLILFFYLMAYSKLRLTHLRSQCGFKTHIHKPACPYKHIYHVFCKAELMTASPHSTLDQSCKNSRTSAYPSTPKTLSGSYAFQSCPQHIYNTVS